MSDLELLRLAFLADVSAVTSTWPARARAGLSSLVGTPDGIVAIRLDGDDPVERAANARAFARWWYAQWQARDTGHSTRVPAAASLREAVSESTSAAGIPLPTKPDAARSLALLASLMERFGPEVGVEMWLRE